MAFEPSPQKLQFLIIGLIFFILTFTLFAFSAYLCPYLLFGWVYDVPKFIIELQTVMHEAWQISERLAAWLIFVFLLVISAVLALVAYTISDLVDNHRNPEDIAKNPFKHAHTPDETRETISLLSKIILIVIAVFLGAIVVQWIIYTQPPEF